MTMTQGSGRRGKQRLLVGSLRHAAENHQFRHPNTSERGSVSARNFFPRSTGATEGRHPCAQGVGAREGGPDAELNSESVKARGFLSAIINEFIKS